MNAPLRSISAIALATLVSCATTTSPTSPAATEAAPHTPHGFTIEEEARILALEDRREFDPVLVAEWIAHPNALHRRKIALALARVGPHAFIDANANNEKDPGEKQAGVAELTTLVSDPDRSVREMAAFALGEIGDPASIDVLFRFAADPDANIAAEAAEALAKLATTVPIARYAALTVASQPEGVRARAVRYLFRFNSDEASAIAANLLESPSSTIRQEAAYALARRAYAPAREKLALVATDASTLTRAYGAIAHGRIGSKESIPLLINLLGDIHPWVRTNALVAIGRVATADPTAIDRPQLAQDVLRILAATEDPDPGTRSSAIDVLGYYATRDPSAKNRLLEFATNGSRWDRELAAGTIAKQFAESDPKLIPENLSNWARVRALEGSAALKKSGPAWRKRLAADPDALVRANAVGNIPDAEVDNEITLVRGAMADPDVVVRATAIERYAASKKESTQKKFETLRAVEQRSRNESDSDARLAAIAALADIDYPEREAFLRSLITDRDPVVRRVAAGLIEEKLKKNRPQYTPLPVDRDPAEYAQIVEWSRQPHTATIHMTRGRIEIALLAQEAPVTAWNFAQLAKQKFFDNSSFMRVVPNFVIQGGDPRNDMSGGPGYSIRDEMNLQKYTRGAVGMALSGPDTGGSQFFITHSPQPHLDGGYTIFGRVYDGMGGVVDQTERGDRIETITIDAHAPVSAAEIAPIQTTPLPTEIGRVTADRLLQAAPGYAQRKEDYKPDVSVVEMIASSSRPEDHVEVYMGTWCPDSQREVPKFLKVVDIIRNQFGKELPASFVAIDRSKTKPVDLLAGKSIEKVATFIYYRGDRELGRIVETPTGLFEDDLLAIVARE